MKGMLAGLAAMGVGAIPSSAFDQQQSGMSHRDDADFWKRVDRIKARDLVDSAIKAARAEIESQRAVNASQRAAVLLGGDAGKEQLEQAKMHYRTRTAELQNAKRASAQFLKGAGTSGNSRFTDWVGKGGLKELTVHARRSAVESLLNSDVSPAEAKAAVGALDERLARLGAMSSFEQMTSYLDQHLDELIGRKMSDEDPNGFCILLLLITSIYVVLLIIAILICIFSLGFACEGVLDRLLAQACP